MQDGAGALEWSEVEWWGQIGLQDVG